MSYLCRDWLTYHSSYIIYRNLARPPWGREGLLFPSIYWSIYIPCLKNAFDFFCRDPQIQLTLLPRPSIDPLAQQRMLTSQRAGHPRSYPEGSKASCTLSQHPPLGCAVVVSIPRAHRNLVVQVYGLRHYCSTIIEDHSPYSRSRYKLMPPKHVCSWQRNPWAACVCRGCKLGLTSRAPDHLRRSPRRYGGRRSQRTSGRRAHTTWSHAEPQIVWGALQLVMIDH